MRLAFSDDEIPLWSLAPTIANIARNVVIGRLEAGEPCIVLLEGADGTCLIAYGGLIARAVTDCLRDASLEI